MQESHRLDLQFVFEIVEPFTPLVILYGARGSGKTMTWIRLTRYLVTQGYMVIPDPIFRPSSDKKYREQCENFGKFCYGDYAPCDIDYMLLKVMDRNGRFVCQVLELPGEFYFDPDNFHENSEMSPALERLMNLRNPKIWIFMLELDVWNYETRIKYVEKIDHILHRRRIADAILTCPKIDMHQELFTRHNVPEIPKLFKRLKDQYPGIFSLFLNRNPFTRFFKKYTCTLVPFSAGDFYQMEDGRLAYIQGRDIYPKLLCKAIIKAIRHAQR